MSSTRVFAVVVALLVPTTLVVAWPDGESGPTSRAIPGSDEWVRPKGTVHISVRSEPPTVATGALDREGRPVRVACSNCHTTKTPRRETVSGEQLKVFHEGLTTRHGAVSCLSCHNATDYDSLHRADGSRLAFVDVMELCGQCHGPQRRDYDAGAHGGMTGYWDLSRGDRTRNSCVDCHNPHAPAYPKVWPVFKPAKDNR